MMDIDHVEEFAELPEKALGMRMAWRWAGDLGSWTDDSLSRQHGQLRCRGRGIRGFRKMSIHRLYLRSNALRCLDSSYGRGTGMGPNEFHPHHRLGSFYGSIS